MLILGREIGEVIVINGNIRIRLLEVRGRKVRLGIEAPPDVPVHREEVWARIQAQRGAPNGPQENV